MPSRNAERKKSRNVRLGYLVPYRVSSSNGLSPLVTLVAMVVWVEFVDYVDSVELVGIVEVVEIDGHWHN